MSCRWPCVKLKKRRLSLDGRALGTFALLLGLMGIAVSMSLYQLAVARVQASVVGVLFSSVISCRDAVCVFAAAGEKSPKSDPGLALLDVTGIVLIIRCRASEASTLV